MSVEQALNDLGLTQAEIKVYLALLKHGPCGPVVIREETGLHNSVVHRTFERLNRKGLVSHTFVGSRKKYVAVDPKRLLGILDESRESIQKIIPQLDRLRVHNPSLPIAEIYEGSRALKNLYWKLLDHSEKKYMTMGAGLPSLTALGEPFWELFMNERKKKKILAQVLFHESLRKVTRKMRRKKQAEDIRFLTSDFEQSTETVTVENALGIIMYGESPFGFFITEPSIVNSYRQYFRVLWKQAKQ